MPNTDSGAAASVANSPEKGQLVKSAKHGCAECGMSTQTVYFRSLMLMLIGTVKTDQWRSGPTGRATLCNACGLRLRYAEKKRNLSNSHGASASNSAKKGQAINGEGRVCDDCGMSIQTLLFMKSQADDYRY
jgi:hypothetical protein